MDNKIHVLEVKTQTELIKSFNKQYKFINENFIILLENPQVVMREYDRLEKGLEQDTKVDIENFWEKMGLYKIVDIVVKNSKKQLNRGYTYMFKLFKEDTVKLGVDFNLENKYAIEYLKQLEDLHLSNYRGSITHTTKLGIIDILRDGIINQETPTEIGQKISGLNKNIFAKSRAELIATREIGKANEVGGNIVAKQMADKGARVLKKWLTVNDDRVEPSHTVNQAQGWIGINEIFVGTGDSIAPANNNPRCRCTVTYNVL